VDTAEFSCSEHRLHIKLRISGLFWGGLRGALALALALGLPQDLPGRPIIITVTFAVVAFSIIVQGLTMPPLLRAIGEIQSDRRNDAQQAAHLEEA